MKPESRVPVGLSSSRKRSGNSMKFPYTRALPGVAAPEGLGGPTPLGRAPAIASCPYKFFTYIYSVGRSKKQWTAAFSGMAAFRPTRPVPKDGTTPRNIYLEFYRSLPLTSFVYCL
ncbi:MAG: hypothetical protein F6J93_31700 [Oscillatoria sp. SIO1A7]|nr:hypothetical protein [Oscillatoria sp. SIO1A7]